MPPRAQSKTASFKKAAKKSLPPVSQQTLDALMNLRLDAPSAPLPPKKPAKATGAALLAAASANDTAEACRLVKAGADVNAKELNGWTPLIYAADRKNEKLMKALLDKGADINHRDTPMGAAAIHFAAEGENDKVLRLLIDRGASLDVRNNQGETPLYYAAGMGREACVKLLIDSGCDVGAKTLAGKSVVYAAAQGRHGVIAELLLTYPGDSVARREALAAQKIAAYEALLGAQTVLQEKVTVGRPLVLKSPLK